MKHLLIEYGRWEKKPCESITSIPLPSTPKHKMMLLSDTSIYAATREQTITSWKRTAVEWGTGLTLDEYIDRELVGEQREFARDKQITWVLAPRNNPTTLDFFCSCETFKREIAISRPSNKPGEEPKLEKGIGYGIASVFTAPQHRKKGYARHMMKLLHWVLSREEYLSTKVFPEAEWGLRPERAVNAGDGLVAALWSDIGPTFYQECGMGADEEERDGWLVMNPFSTIWKVSEVGIEEGGRATWLDEDMAQNVWDEDAESMRSEMVDIAKKTGRVQFSFLPNHSVALFQWFRLHYHFSRYVANAPKHCGVQTAGGSFATWTCEFRPGMTKTLIITRLRAIGNGEDVMNHVLEYARRHGLEEVEVWNFPGNIQYAGGAVVERTEHFPAIRWYDDERVDWVFNERFCWC